MAKAGVELEERKKLLHGAGESRFSQQLGYDTFEEHVFKHPAKERNFQQTDTFLRKTFKFFVLPSKFLTVKRRVSNYLPEFRYDGKESDSLAESGSVINSVYMDNADLELYNYRILQVDDSMLFRYRWYSSESAMVKRDGFMEQKLRQPAWRGLPTLKQRFRLDPSLVPSFIEGGPAVVPLKEAIVENMHSYMDKVGGLRHCIRSQYRRTAFADVWNTRYRRDDEDVCLDTVRLSFDEDVTLLDVSAVSWEQACDPSHSLPSHRVFHFPLGILEVKLGFESFEDVSTLRMPNWIVQMQRAGLLIETAKFSKYCTGCAVMNLHIITRVPSWLAAVKTLMEIELARRGREWFHIEKDTTPHWEIIAEKVVIPQRCEPREYLANERTLLKWVRMAFLALFVGLALLGFQHEPVTGIVLSVCAMVLLFRAYYMYRIRMEMLQTKNFDRPFYDPYGPLMILALFVVPTLTYLMFCMGVFDVSSNNSS